MLNSRQLLGRKGEDIAVKALSGRGYSIVATNYRCRLGEIDIIARDGAFLVFVEVKTRTSSFFGTAAAAVTPKKQLQISRAAQWYLTANQLLAMDARFDVVEINRTGDGGFSVNHIIDAFEMKIS
jgi:putative endonuclease